MGSLHNIRRIRSSDLPHTREVQLIVNVRPRNNLPGVPNRVVSHSSLPYKNHPTNKTSQGITAMDFTKALNKFFKYIADALGIKPEEPPIISDHPPLHSVNGELKLGENE